MSTFSNQKHSIDTSTKSKLYIQVIGCRSVEYITVSKVTCTEHAVFISKGSHEQESMCRHIVTNYLKGLLQMNPETLSKAKWFNIAVNSS